MNARRCLNSPFAIRLFALLVVLLAAAVPPVAAQNVVVSLADPSVAPQGTVNLNVIIKGKGFKRGAVSRFFVTNTGDPGGVTVQSTTYVNSTELVANIDVAENAQLSTFDIEVQNADGRTGKGIELFTVTAKGAGAAQDALATADFRDSETDGVRSDGQTLPDGCSPGDYADFTDPCAPGHRGVSKVFTTGQYFLRTGSGQVPEPTRWLVLDFGASLAGSACQALDTKLLDYPGRNPDAFSPEDPDPCVDLLMVRFSADKAFAPGAEYTPVGVIIDGPNASTVQSTGTQWNAKYYLDFVNPLAITRVDANTVVLNTMAGLEQAQLWTVHPKSGKRQTLVGTYWMPFEVTIVRRP